MKSQEFGKFSLMNSVGKFRDTPTYHILEFGGLAGVGDAALCGLQHPAELLHAALVDALQFQVVLLHHVPVLLAQVEQGLHRLLQDVQVVLFDDHLRHFVEDFGRVGGVLK